MFSLFVGGFKNRIEKKGREEEKSQKAYFLKRKVEEEKVPNCLLLLLFEKQGEVISFFGYLNEEN